MTDAEKKLAEIAKIVENGTIEDVKAVLEGKPRKWVPEKDEVFYYINENSQVIDDMWWGNQNVDIDKLNYNNCFRTEEEAKRVRDYRQRHGHKDSILSLMEEAAKADREANPNVKDKYYIVGGWTSKWLIVDPTYILPLPPFATQEAAQAFIDKYEDELEVLKPEES